MAASAAAKCSARMRSTVAANSGTLSPEGGPLRGVNEKAVEVGDALRVRGVDAAEGRPNMPFVPGVADSDGQRDLAGRRLASAAALSRRLVVPSALVDPERAEQTTAILCWWM